MNGQGPRLAALGQPGGSRGVVPPGQRGQGPVTEEGGLGPPGGSRGVAPPGQQRPLLRLLRLARPLRARLLAAVLAGAAATCCGVALLAVSGFLLARASQHPGIVAISVAVVAVRGLSAGRGVSRYLERLASHDVAFRILADIRTAVYRAAERLAPAGLAAFRSGDLLARLISDVDATQDLFLRGIGPPLAAAVAGGAAVAACLLILAPAGAVLALGLLTAGVAVPAVAVVVSRRSARLTAPARGELGATLTGVLTGAADLLAFGADDDALAAAAAVDARLTRLERRSAVAVGAGTGLMTLVSGLTVWGVLVLGVLAVSGGTLGRVPLAVVTLAALASFEAVTVLPAAALQLGSARAAARRLAAVLDAPGPVTEPARPRPLPPGPVHLRLRGVRVRYAPDGPLALDGLDLDLGLARPGATDGELADAAARARLLPWIRGLPRGWDTQVGTHGTAMSGGERQRLILARALLADPAVLILDEPTAHLDRETAAALTADLLRLTAGRTTLLITHDMRGLELLDEIVVLDRGRVVQRGTHEQLSRADGPYRRLRAAGPAG